MNDFQVGDKVFYKGEVHILALFLNDMFCSIHHYETNKELTVGISELTAYTETHNKVYTKLRTNEALEEDLRIAKDKINTLVKKLTLTYCAVADALDSLEKSEDPFYRGMKTLQGILNNKE